MAQPAIDRLRTAAAAKHLRLPELFADFDPLRTGLVTRSQLERCISNATGVILSNDVWDSIFATMPSRKDNLVAYRPVADMLSGGSERVLPEAPAELHPHLQAAMVAIRNHCIVHGITIRSAFEDFDPLNRGVVSKSQFLRCLPAPQNLSPEHRAVIADHYTRTDTGVVDYYHMMRDIEGYPQVPTSARPPTRGLHNPSDLFPSNRAYSPGKENTASRSTDNAEAMLLVNQLAAAFYRTRVRPIEYFRDFDRLRKGVVTENQFVSGLSMACSAPGGLRLSHTALLTVAHHFGNSDGTVRYRDFCTHTDNAFLTGREEDLVRAPTAEVEPLIRSQVLCETQALPDDDELRLQQILARLRAVVDSRRISVHPLMQDADRRLGFTKGVTAAQLRRVMDSLNLPLNDADMPFLMAKFGNPVTGHFNYHAFCAAIDESTKFGQTEQLYTDTMALSLKHTLPPQTLSNTNNSTSAPVDVDVIIDAIRVRVLEMSLRAEAVFKEFDPLRHGKIHREKFVRGVSQLYPTLTQPQLNALADRFKANTDLVDWVTFVDATKDKSAPAEAEVMVLSTLKDTVKQRTRETTFDATMMAGFREAMNLAAAKMIERRFDLAGPLQDADRTKCSHITESQFVRVLSQSPLGLNTGQIRTIALYYMEPSGVNYHTFLRDVTPSIPLEDLFATQTERRLNTAQQRPQSTSSEGEWKNTAEAIIQKLHRKVVRERVDVRQFLKNFDHHGHGRITTSEFQRCLVMAQLYLSPTDLTALSTLYASSAQPGYVEYAKFCSDLDASFATPSLERNPTTQAAPFIPPPDIEVAAQHRKTRNGENAAADALLARMAVRVSQRRLVVQTLFQDFDRAVVGTVSKGQFVRVLSNLGLCDGATEAELDALVRRYAVQTGGREDVHYRSYCRDVDLLACNEHARTIAF